MPKLPSVDDFNYALPSGGRALQQASGMTEVAGRGLKLAAEGIDKFVDDQQKLEYQMAKAQLMKHDMELRRNLDQDPEYESTPDKYNKSLSVAAPTIGANLIGKYRQQFDIDAEETKIRGDNDFRTMVNGKRKEIRSSMSMNILNDVKDMAAKEKDPVTHAELIGQMQDITATMVHAGLLDAGKGQDMLEGGNAVDVAKIQAENEDPEVWLDSNKPKGKPSMSYRDRLNAVEGMKKNPLSSASGKYQFIDSTWIDTVKKHSPKHAGMSDQQILALKKSDDAFKDEMFDALTEDNHDYLTSKLGREPTDGELYLAHQQGPVGAVKLLSNPSAKASDLVGVDAIKNNGGNVNMTAAEFAGKWVEGFGKEKTYEYKSNGNPLAEVWRRKDPDSYFATIKQKTEEAKKSRENKFGNALVQAQLNGASVVDPTSSDHKKAVNTFYDSAVLDMPEDEKLAYTAKFIERTSLVPESVRNTMTANISRGSITEKVTAAENIAQIVTQYPFAKESFDEKTMSRAFAIRDYTASGLKPEEAMSRVEEADLVPEATRKAREGNKETLKAMYDSADKSLKKMAAPWFSSNAVIPDDMNIEMHDLMRRYYINTGNVEGAQDFANHAIMKRWNLSEFGGVKKYQRHPPENYYPAMETGWMEKQVLSELREAGILPDISKEDKEIIAASGGLLTEAAMGGTEDYGISLISDILTEKTAALGNPTYAVYATGKSGVPERLLQKDGTPVRYAPDYALTDGAKKTAEEKRKIVEEWNSPEMRKLRADRAEKQAAGLPIESEWMLKHPILNSLFQPGPASTWFK